MDLVSSFRDQNWTCVNHLVKKVYQRLVRQKEIGDILIEKLCALRKRVVVSTTKRSTVLITRAELRTAKQEYGVTMDEVRHLSWLLEFFKDTKESQDRAWLGNPPMTPLRVDKDKFNASVVIVKKYEQLGWI